MTEQSKRVNEKEPHPNEKVAHGANRTMTTSARKAAPRRRIPSYCEFATHRARPHMALGPGVPDPPPAATRPSTQLSRHQIGGRLVLRVKSILGGLHHEYSLAPALA